MGYWLPTTHLSDSRKPKDSCSTETCNGFSRFLTIYPIPHSPFPSTLKSQPRHNPIAKIQGKMHQTL
jgi:hypothetical protein